MTTMSGDKVYTGFALKRGRTVKLVQSSLSAIVPIEGDLYRMVFVTNS